MSFGRLAELRQRLILLRNEATIAEQAHRESVDRWLAAPEQAPDPTQRPALVAADTALELRLRISEIERDIIREVLK
jgi:hypothetical protein